MLELPVIEAPPADTMRPPDEIVSCESNETAPPATASAFDECVTVTSPELKLMIPPGARNRSDHFCDSEPNAAPSSDAGAAAPAKSTATVAVSFVAVLAREAVPPATSPHWSVAGTYRPVLG